MKKLLALLFLLPSLVFAQPLPGQSINVNRYGGITTSLGQKTASASVPVVIASDQIGLIASQATLASVIKPNSFGGTYDFVTVGGYDASNGVYHGLPLTTFGTAVNVSGSISISGADITVLTDNLANPVVVTAAGFGMYWDGATWDRMRGTSVDGMLVNLGANNDVTVTSGTIAATQSGTWNVGTLGTITNVVHVDDNSGSLTVDGTVTANQGGAPWSENITQLGGNSINTGSGAASTGTARIILATDSPVSSCAATKQYNASLSNTGTTAITSITKYYGMRCGNGNTTNACFARAYDKSSAATSSDTPIDKIDLAPVSSNRDPIDCGTYQTLVNGLSLRGTTGVADSNTTSPTANDCHCTAYYN